MGTYRTRLNQGNAERVMHYTTRHGTPHHTTLRHHTPPHTPPLHKQYKAYTTYRIASHVLYTPHIVLHHTYSTHLTSYCTCMRSSSAACSFFCCWARKLLISLTSSRSLT